MRNLLNSQVEHIFKKKEANSELTHPKKKRFLLRNNFSKLYQLNHVTLAN